MTDEINKSLMIDKDTSEKPTCTICFDEMNNGDTITETFCDKETESTCLNNENSTLTHLIALPA